MRTFSLSLKKRTLLGHKTFKEPDHSCFKFLSGILFFPLKIFCQYCRLNLFCITAKIQVSVVTERWKLETSRRLFLFLFFAQCRNFPAKLKYVKLFWSKVNKSLRCISIYAQNILLHVKLLDFVSVNFPDK